jgi:2,3-bisphosphoglycerate-independent phosphoglycerate mutase
VLDGVGITDDGPDNAVSCANMPTYRRLLERGAATTLAASGAAVGLPEGARGSGEAGHRTLGAGRVVESARVRIDQAIAQGKLGRNPTLDALYQLAVYDGAPLHLIGLLSTAGVHSSFEHLRALVDLAAFHEVPIIVHAILDGIDTPPKAAAGLLDRLSLHLEGKRAQVGSLSGRHYAMDVEGRWDRVSVAYQAIVRDKVLGPFAPRAETWFDALNLAYMQGQTDAFVEPTRIGDYAGFRGDFLCDFSDAPPVWEWTGEDCGLIVNHRPDGLRQLTQLLARADLPDEVTKDLLMDRHHPVRAFRDHYLATLVPMSHGLSLPVAFASPPAGATLGATLAAAGLTQLRIAESDRRDHLTTFFDGGAHAPPDGAEVELVPAPRLIERPDERPALSVARVAERAAAAVAAGSHDVVVVHLGNAERVAGTGDRSARIEALEALDRALGRVVESVESAGGALVVTADHGGCEAHVDERGRRLGAHSSNPVPLVVLADGQHALRANGSLADVAPTLLELLGLAAPGEMTGRSLLAGA